MTMNKQPTTMTMNKQPTTNHDQKGEYMLFDFKKDVPFPEPERPKFKFIDLFAGIGGFHLAFHNVGAECVMASEIDIHARKTYEVNFSKLSPKLFNEDMLKGDLLKIPVSDIPDFDILCAGFPCQPFSQIGYRRGFLDSHENRGNMFFEIANIIEKKKPHAFFLENVRHLLKHDNGDTFRVIKDVLEGLGYSFHYKVVKASDYGLPQHRPRVFMVGFRGEKTNNSSFMFPAKKPLIYDMSDIFQGECEKQIGFTLRVGGRGSKIHDRRNWEFYRVDGSVKRLGVKEGKMMQGFPLDFVFPVSESQSMKQLGNSVAVKAIEEVAKQIVQYLKVKNLKYEGILSMKDYESKLAYV